MSYKVSLSDLGEHGSVTSALVQRFTTAIESGLLESGEKLPTTRELASAAGVNPMTAARVYRRLAERGYVVATVGRGTFVRTLPPFAAGDADDEWQALVLPPWRHSARERSLQTAMRSAAPGSPDGVITMGIAMPAPETLPTAELATAATDLFEELGPRVLGVTDVEGMPELREQLALIGRRTGFAESEEEILVTTGARQAIDLVARTLLVPGDVVCTESPTFAGTLSSFEAAGARLIAVPTDDDGLDLDVLERALARHEVKLVALQPVSHNPTGRQLSPERRRKLAELAQERSFFVLEDGTLAGLRFGDDQVPALRADAPGHVIYTGSLSKTVGGGLRLGWLAARGPVVRRLVQLKMSTDLHSPVLPQGICARWLATGAYEPLLRSLGPFYRSRAEALQSALARHLEGEVDVVRPLGGLCVWATFRRRVDEEALVARAAREGVVVTPGSSLLVEESTRTSVRLSFSLVDEEQIDEGVRRLAAAYRAVLRSDRYGATVPASS